MAAVERILFEFGEKAAGALVRRLNQMKILLVELRAKARFEIGLGDKRNQQRLDGINRRIRESTLVVGGLNRELKKVNATQRRSSGRLRNLGRGFSGLSRGIGRAISRVQSMTFAVIALGGAIIRASTQLTSIGSAVVGTQKAFTRTAAAIGETSDSLLVGLRRASQGAISDMGLMSSATFAFLAGAKLTREEINTLTEASVKLAGIGIRTTAGEVLSAENIFNRFTQGIVKQERRIVDDMTVVIRARDVMKEFGDAALQAAGGNEALARTIAFKMAIVQAARDRLETLKDVDVSLTLVGSKLNATFQNFINRLGEMFVKSGAATRLLGALQNVLGGIIAELAKPGKAKEFFDGIIKAVVVVIRLFEKLIPLLVKILGFIDLIVGALSGGTVGAGIGAAIGSIIPGVGTALGGVIGGVTGAVGGAAFTAVSGAVPPTEVGDEIGRALEPSFQVNREGLEQVTAAIRRRTLQPEVQTVV